MRGRSPTASNTATRCPPTPSPPFFSPPTAAAVVTVVDAVVVAAPKEETPDDQQFAFLFFSLTEFACDQGPTGPIEDTNHKKQNCCGEGIVSKNFFLNRCLSLVPQTLGAARLVGAWMLSRLCGRSQSRQSHGSHEKRTSIANSAIKGRLRPLFLPAPIHPAVLIACAFFFPRDKHRVGLQT